MPAATWEAMSTRSKTGRVFSSDSAEARGRSAGQTRAQWRGWQRVAVPEGVLCGPKKVHTPLYFASGIRNSRCEYTDPIRWKA